MCEMLYTHMYEMKLEKTWDEECNALNMNVKKK